MRMYLFPGCNSYSSLAMVKCPGKLGERERILVYSSKVDPAHHGKEGLSHFILTLDTGGDHVQSGYKTSNYPHSSGLTSSRILFQSFHSPPKQPLQMGTKHSNTSLRGAFLLKLLHVGIGSPCCLRCH